jgi:tyrosine-protein kinase Etk/Wzc
MEDHVNINNGNTNRGELWGLSARDIFYKYVRFLPLFLLSLAAALLVAWIYLRYSTRIYSSTGTMLIKNEKPASREDKVEDILEGSNRSQNIQNEIEIMRSRPLMERVVNRIHLQVSYIANGKIKEFNVYKLAPFQMEVYEIADSSASFSTKIKMVNSQMFRIDNESNFSFGKVFQNKHGIFRLIKTGNISPGSEFTVNWDPTSVVASNLVTNLKVQPQTPGTGIVAVSIQTSSALMSADIVNSLMVQYDSMTVEQNNFSTDQMLHFIDERLNIFTREIDTLQAKYLRYKQLNNLIDPEVQSSNYFERIGEADKSINEQRFRLSIADDITSYLKDKSKEYLRIVVPSSLGLEDLTLNELVAGYNKAQLERQSLLDSKVPIENPAVKEVEGQIEKLRESILENLKNVRAVYASSIETLKTKSSFDESELKAMPFKLKELVEMERQINTKLTLYNLLQGKREEAAIGRASTISNSKIINLATPSLTPVKPNKRAIQILAVLIGLGLPALIIFIAEVVNDKVSTRFDIERITKAPILGEVGHSYSEKTLIVNKTSRGMVAEQFRIIRSNLQYILPQITQPVIMVTSSVSGEGKSFVSINIGAVLSLAGKKTVILEFDIRKPKILSGIGMSKKSGISNYLLGKGELEDLIIPVPDQPNLFVLPCGPIPPNPSELLLDPKVTDMFTKLRANFEAIIVDTAPVGMVSDAMTLGKFADCTLYLVRQGHTFKKQITLIDEFYEEKKLPRVSIIINDVKLKPGYGYYGYGRYGYGYGYAQKSSYYEEEAKPISSFEKFISKIDPRRWVGLKK